MRNTLSILLFFISLILIFDVEIRSIGHPEVDPVAPILFLSIPAAKIAYFGLLLPIFAFALLVEDRSDYVKGGLLFYLLGATIYGTLMSIIRQNEFFPYAAADLLVCLSLFTGLCLGALLPNTLKKISAVISLTSLSATMIAAAILFSLPDADFFSSFTRITHPSAFILLGFPLVLTAPSMIIATLTRSWIVMAISWANAGIFIIIAAFITQTRSLAIAVFFSIILSIVTIAILSENNEYHSAKSKSHNKWGAIVLFLLVISALYLLKDNWEAFLSRMQSALNPIEDGGIAPRLEEVPTVLGGMNIQDHVAGMGFGPALILTDWRGDPHNTMHIGMFNIWWRLGLPFLISIIITAVQNNVK